MSKVESEMQAWAACPKCLGRGSKSRRIRKKVRLFYLKQLDEFEKAKGEGPAPVRPKGHLEPCFFCLGSGLVPAEAFPKADTEHFPHVAIIGGGIGGAALAVACLHRGIPFSLYERDGSFSARSQGYGLTLQQATRVVEGLGIADLADGVVSTRHVVHTPEGKVVGEWGMRKWVHAGTKTGPKRTNIHIARQSLRSAILKQLGDQSLVKWNHQLLDYTESEAGVDLRFQVNGEITHEKADLVVGADGIRSVVRRQLIGEETTPLRYLGCLVILGICPLSALGNVESELLDSATVFQTANGNERIYIMPYDAESVMWQLSFPMDEAEAKALSAQGAQALKEEAIRRTPWHAPVPQIVAATEAALVSGYPVYDRELLTEDLISKGYSSKERKPQQRKATLIGDAAHPMSPFKGQGANQALLDALALARSIYMGCRPGSEWRKIGIQEAVLAPFEAEMLKRSAVKVADSAAAAEFLHSDLVLNEADEPRGRSAKLQASDSDESRS